MKSVNGNNKAERLVNKAKKYLDLTLRLASNKYWEIEKDSLNDSHFIVLPSTIKVVNGKFGQCLRIQPLNSIDDKCYFIPIYKAMHLTHWGKNLYLIKVNDKDIPEFLEIAKGDDDVITAISWIDTNETIQVDKNAFDLKLI